MTKIVTMLILMATSGLLTAPFVYGASSGPMGGGYTQTPPGANNTVEMLQYTAQDAAADMAVASYNAGLNHKKHAQEYEVKAATAKNDKDRDKAAGEGPICVQGRDRGLQKSDRLRQHRLSGDERTRVCNAQDG